LCNVVEINNTEIIRQTIKEKYETYINTLRDTITKFQTEWDTLYESYQNLLGDIKKLIINNERLKALVLELEGRIESHNQQVIGNDISIKQQIEVLTRQSLSKKTIDWNSQKEVINRTGAEMEAINSKVKRMEMKEFSSSSILASVTDDMESFTKANRTTVVTTSTITAGEITDQGYTMNSYVSGNSSHLLRNSNIVQSSYVTNEVYSNNIPANNTVSFTTTTTTNGNTFTRFVDK
jgi:glutathione peroxidase-family protein